MSPTDRERHSPTPELLSVARGDSPPDLLLRGGRVLNVFTQSFQDRDVLLHRGLIARVSTPEHGPAGADIIDCAGRFIAPGFIDAHMHIESTMLPPSEFARLAVPRGTTSVIADPHEIANVLGVEGIEWMMRNAQGLPISIWWMLSSCVPSCHLETSGATITADDLAPLFADAPGPVLGLAEMMNFPGAANADPAVLDKVRLGLQHGVVDGHAPGLTGDLLQAYIAAGITSDHECTTADEAHEKLALGQRIWIREGSAARNLDALLPAVTDDNFHRFAFCTDDRHPADLREQGHIDHVVRRAIERGMRPERALTLASTFVAQHYNLPHLGAIAPGYQADLVVFDDPKAPSPSLVVQRGQVVARDGVYLPGRKLLTSHDTKAVRLGHTVNIPATLSADDLRIPVQGTPAPNIRVIGMDPHQLVTEHLTMPPTVDDGAYIADPARDLLKLCVIERHTGSRRIGRGFVTGFKFNGGALASTVGHDAHNLAVVGDDDADMIVAARAVADAGGGQAVARAGKVLEVLKLPIAGLMSDEPAEEVIAAQARLLYAAHALGCPHHDPFMPLSFLPLPVIPKLKLSDLGLVDVERFELVALEA